MANTILTFGKHAKKDIEAVPSNYLEWLLQQNWFQDQYEVLVQQIEAELAYRTDHDAHFVD